MKTNRSITTSILAFILFFYSPFLSDFKAGAFFDFACSKSFRQESYIDLQYVLVLKTEKEFENDTLDDDLPVCCCPTNIHLNDVKIRIILEKPNFPIQISILNWSPRSPPVL